MAMEKAKQLLAHEFTLDADPIEFIQAVKRCGLVTDQEAKNRIADIIGHMTHESIFKMFSFDLDNTLMVLKHCMDFKAVIVLYNDHVGNVSHMKHDSVKKALEEITTINKGLSNEIQALKTSNTQVNEQWSSSHSQNIEFRKENDLLKQALNDKEMELLRLKASLYDQLVKAGTC